MICGGDGSVDSEGVKDQRRKRRAWRMRARRMIWAWHLYMKWKLTTGGRRLYAHSMLFVAHMECSAVKLWSYGYDVLTSTYRMHDRTLHAFAADCRI